MGFLSGNVSYLRFRVAGTPPAVFGDDHLDALRDRMAGRQRVATADGVETGWSAGDSVLDTDFTLEKQVVNDALCFDFRVDTDKLPADLLRAYYAAEVKALAAGNPSGFPSAKQKRAASFASRDRLEAEAKDGRFRRRKCVPVLWDRAAGTVYFGATGFGLVDKFAALFEQTFGAELTAVTAGRMAAGLTGHNLDGPDAVSPAPFVTSTALPGVAWIADDRDPSFLGNEFLLWLWWQADAGSDTLKLADGSEAAFMFARSLVLDCQRGQHGADAFRSDSPVRLPEARRAAQAGKLPRRAGLTLVRHDRQYELTLHAETLAVGGAKLPKADDDATGRAVIEHRVDAVRGLAEACDRLYALFLSRRLGPAWAEDLASMQRWLSRPERGAA